MQIRAILTYYLDCLLILINVIIFIIRVLKLLSMHGTYFFLVFAVIMVLASPAAGSLTKVVAGAPVYIGEQNLDISAGLQGCRIIDWWEAGADMNAPPSKNVTIIETLEKSEIAHGYTISPAIFSGSEGTWYCEGKRPLRAVFEVVRPRISVRFWDLDNDTDINGKTIPLTANITYRIDTNLDRALQVRYRPEITPLDSFYTVTLIDPYGTSLSTVYTGTLGKTDTKGILLEKKPFISASPYVWKDGNAWDRTSKNTQGDSLYPVGTYTITVNQDLNHMREMYPGTTPADRAGLLEASATVIFIKPVSTPVQTVSEPTQVSLSTGTPSLPGSPSATLTEATIPSNRTTAPRNTTYAPLPLWVVPAALGIALACTVRQRK
jgi:hypothetical protein